MLKRLLRKLLGADATPQVAEAKYKAIIEIASDAIISVDETLRITDFNSGAEQLFGYPARDMIGQHVEMLIPERYRKGHQAHMRAFAEGPVAARRMGERSEIAGLRRDGREFPAEASISKLMAGDKLVMTVLMRDITVRKRLHEGEQILAKAGAKLASSLDFDSTIRTIVDLPVELIAACSVLTLFEDQAPRIVQIAHKDPEAESRLSRFLGHELKDGTWSPSVEAVHTAHSVYVPNLAERAATANADMFITEIIATGVVACVSAPLISGGRAFGALSLYLDANHEFGVEELLLTEELARRSSLAIDNARLYRDAQTAIRARDDILSVVSHDLGNPLSAIRIGTSLLLRTIPQEQRDSGGWQHLEAIRQSTAQMERLINDLLDTKRIEAGLLSMHCQRHEIDVLVSNAVELMAPIANSKDVRLQSHLASPLPLVLADGERISQVFSNVIGNAVKFSSAGGLVSVSTRRDGNEIVFEVTDQGPGIAPDELPRVFDRFWSARGTGRAGTGLGLAISKSIVEAHGGRISAISEPGKGTTMRFTLPIEPID